MIHLNKNLNFSAKNNHRLQSFQLIKICATYYVDRIGVRYGWLTLWCPIFSLFLMLCSLNERILPFSKPLTHSDVYVIYSQMVLNFRFYQCLHFGKRHNCEICKGQIDSKWFIRATVSSRSSLDYTLGYLIFRVTTFLKEHLYFRAPAFANFCTTDLTVKSYFIMGRP